MTTLLVSQPNFADHITPQGHPERAERIAAVEKALADVHFASLVRREAGPDGEPRFGMLDTVREFALERLAEVRSQLVS